MAAAAAAAAEEGDDEEGGGGDSGGWLWARAYASISDINVDYFHGHRLTGCRSKIETAHLAPAAKSMVRLSHVSSLHARALAAHVGCNAIRHGVRGGDRGRGTAPLPLAPRPSPRPPGYQPAPLSTLVPMQTCPKRLRGKGERMEAGQAQRMSRNRDSHCG